MRYFEIQIPVKTNNGITFSEYHHSQFEKRLLDLSGGYSKLPEIKGVWIENSPEFPYVEQMIPYRFTTAGGFPVDLVNFAKEHYEQIAIFIAEIGTAQIL